MKKQSHRLSVLIGLIAGLTLTPYATGNTCPTQVHQATDGYWVSDSSPGWKSHKPTATNVKLSENPFGGAVYSPKKKRIACVYRGTHKAWIALISNKKHPFNEDDLEMKNWEFNKKHQDYVCGKPKSTIKECIFSVK